MTKTPLSATSMPQAHIIQYEMPLPSQGMEDAVLDIIDIYAPDTYIHIARYGLAYGFEALAKLVSRIPSEEGVGPSEHWKQILVVLKAARRLMAAGKGSLPVPPNTWRNPSPQARCCEMTVNELYHREAWHRAAEAERARERANPRWPTVNWAQIETAALPRYDIHATPSAVPDLVVTTAEGDLRRLQDTNIYWSVIQLKWLP